jgi:hypothetical protein
MTSGMMGDIYIDDISKNQRLVFAAAPDDYQGNIIDYFRI